MNLIVQSKCGLSKLIEELEVLLKDAPRSEEGEMYRETIIDLQELIQSKQLLAIEELLKVQETLCSHARLQFCVRWTVIVFSLLRMPARASTLRQATCTPW